MRPNKLKFICFLYNKKLQEDLGIDLGDANDIEANITIKVDSIINVRECANSEGEIYKDKCNIEQQGGESFNVKGSYQEVLSRLEQQGW